MDTDRGALTDADLMRRVLTSPASNEWLAGFWHDLPNSQPITLIHPTTVTDRGDGQLIHLDGLWGEGSELRVRLQRFR